jgi:hypothetical protein
MTFFIRSEENCREQPLAIHGRACWPSPCSSSHYCILTARRKPADSRRFIKGSAHQYSQVSASCLRFCLCCPTIGCTMQSSEAENPIMRARLVFCRTRLCLLQRADKSTRFSAWFDEAESPCRMVNLVPRLRPVSGSRGLMLTKAPLVILTQSCGEQEDRGLPANTEYDARPSQVR